MKASYTKFLHDIIMNYEIWKHTEAYYLDQPLHECCYPYLSLLTQPIPGVGGCISNIHYTLMNGILKKQNAMQPTNCNSIMNQ